MSIVNNLDDDMVLDYKMLSNSIERAQRNVESRNFQSRKNVIEFDDVMNRQREIIYGQRKMVLYGEDVSAYIKRMISGVISHEVDAVSHADRRYFDPSNMPALLSELAKVFASNLDPRVSENELSNMTPDDVKQILEEKAADLLDSRKRAIGADVKSSLPGIWALLSQFIKTEDLLSLQEAQKASGDKHAADASFDGLWQRFLGTLFSPAEVAQSAMSEDELAQLGEASETSRKSLIESKFSALSRESKLSQMAFLLSELSDNELRARLESLTSMGDRLAPETAELLRAIVCLLPDERIGGCFMPIIERNALLENVDKFWMDHIDAMQDLRQGIYLRSYAQSDPKVEYKREGFEMFDSMITAIREGAVRQLYSSSIRFGGQAPARREPANLSTSGKASQSGKATLKKKNKPGANEICPCGSGKKFKNCCRGNGKYD